MFRGVTCGCQGAGGRYDAVDDEDGKAKANTGLEDCEDGECGDSKEEWNQCGVGVCWVFGLGRAARHSVVVRMVWRLSVMLCW